MNRSRLTYKSLVSIFIFLLISNFVFSADFPVTDSLNCNSDTHNVSGRSIVTTDGVTGDLNKNYKIFSFSASQGYFPSLAHNFGEQAVSPFKMNAHQWLIAGGAAGVTALLFHFDNDIDKWARVQKKDHLWVRRTSPVITQLGGSAGVYSVLSAGLISAGWGYEKGVQTSLLTTQAMITSGVWVNIIKILTGRERPMADYAFSKEEGGKWSGPFSRFDQDTHYKKPCSAFDSFPSGHTATAFSIATVIARQYSDIKVIPVLCYSTASLVGISRLTEHEHWSSDVFVGAILGYLCGNEVVNHYNKISRYDRDSSEVGTRYKPELSLFQTGNQVGLQIRW